VPEPGRQKAVSLLRELPELGEQLTPEVREAAERQLLAAVVTLAEGRWQPELQIAPGHLGFMVLDGLMTRDVSVRRTTCAEIIGPGDLLRPYDHDGAAAPVPFDIHWNVVQETRLAVLDRRFATMAAQFPEVPAALIASAVQRSSWLAFRLLINSVTRVDVRLLLLFWHLADRYGRVTAEGTFVPVPLTHQLLGKLIGAQRPSVTTALGQLADRGMVERADGGWRLHGDPPKELAQLDSRFASMGG
jgi:hypothetical protein